MKTHSFNIKNDLDYDIMMLQQKESNFHLALYTDLHDLLINNKETDLYFLTFFIEDLIQFYHYLYEINDF